MGEIFKSPIQFDSSKIPNVSVTDYAFALCRKHLPEVAEKPWLVDTTTGKQILFRDVEEKTKRVASALARRGFGHGDFLYFITYDFVDLEVLQLAVWMLGGATRGGFPKGAPNEIARQMNEIKCKFVALDADTAPNVYEALQQLNFKCTAINMEEAQVQGAVNFAEFANDDGSALPKSIKIDPKEDTLIVCNTSGSTGVPKGVVHTHFTVVAVMSSIEGQIGGSHEESQFVTSYNYAISNMWNVLLQLTTGNTMFYMSRLIKEKFVHDILKYKPSKLFLYPYIAGWMVRSEGIEKHDFGFVKNLSLGGAVLDPATAELLEKVFSSALLNQVYASTETLGNSLSLNGKVKAPLYNISPDGERLVTSGFLFPLVEVKVQDLETGALLGKNQLGRLYLRSLNTMKGYLVPGGSPDRSDFVDGDWFDTGDLAFFDTYGQVYIRGKASFMFKYFNNFVHPDEVEAILQEHPSVHMSCVMGVPNVETNHLAKAMVVLKEGYSTPKEELIKLVEQKLPVHKHLHGGLDFVESLPENQGGKLDRVAVWKKYCRMN